MKFMIDIEYMIHLQQKRSPVSCDIFVKNKVHFIFWKTMVFYDVSQNMTDLRAKHTEKVPSCILWR